MYADAFVATFGLTSSQLSEAPGDTDHLSRYERAGNFGALGQWAFSSKRFMVNLLSLKISGSALSSLLTTP